MDEVRPSREREQRLMLGNVAAACFDQVQSKNEVDTYDHGFKFPLARSSPKAILPRPSASRGYNDTVIDRCTDLAGLPRPPKPNSIEEDCKTAQCKCIYVEPVSEPFFNFCLQNDERPLPSTLAW